MGLERFLDAQANPRSGYANARAELLRGSKQSHWIWWVFPQLAGLGNSSVSVQYALEDSDEAVLYLREPVLGARLAESVGIVRRQCEAGIPLRTLMGSPIDCSKLVSCLTLFAGVGREDAADLTVNLTVDAVEVLGIAAEQGFRRCAFTERQLP